MDNHSATTNLHEYDVYEALREELFRNIPSIYRVEKIGGKVYILFREAGRRNRATMHSDVSGIFEEIDRGNEFEFTVCETPRDSLNTSEIEREMLEARIKFRVSELTKNDALGEKIESVEVRWTFWTRVRRVLGRDANDQHAMIFVSDRDMIEDYSAATNLLRRLRAEFDIPVTLENSGPFKSNLLSPRTRFRKDPVDENPIDD